MVTVADAKKYLRLDTDYEDDLVEGLIDASQEYLRVSGVNPTDSSLYKLATQMLVVHFYENRNAVSEKTTKNMPHGLDAILLKLRSR